MELTYRSDLHSNGVTYVPQSSFAGLLKLSSLYVYNNSINAIADNAFSELTALTLLSLGTNQITALTAGTFAGLSKLTQLLVSMHMIWLAKSIDISFQTWYTRYRPAFSLA